MADDITTPGTGEVLAFDDIGGVKFARTKLVHGADGVNDGDVSTANPLPAKMYVNDEFGATTPVGYDGYGMPSFLIGQSAALETIFAIERAQNTATSGGDPGIVALVRRTDTDEAPADTDGSFSMLHVNSVGRLKVTDAALASVVKNEDSPSADGDPGIVMLAQRRDSDSPSVDTDGDYTTLKMDEAGRLKVASQPASYSATVDTITSNGDTVFIECSRFSNLMLHCTGTFSTVNCTFEGSLNSTNGTDGNWFTVQAIRSNANTIETTTGNLSAAPAYAWELSVNGLKYFRVRATAYTSGTQTWTLLPGTYATEPIPGAQVSGTQAVSGTVTANQGTFTAPTANNLNSAATTNGTVVKASAGTLYNIAASNINAAVRYLKLYNSTSVTVGTTTPVLTMAIPAGGFINVNFGVTGHRFTTGICLALTTGAADSDTGAVAANEIKVVTAFI